MCDSFRSCYRGYPWHVTYYLACLTRDVSLTDFKLLFFVWQVICSNYSVLEFNNDF